jgi:NADPH2:quinone reductase
LKAIVCTELGSPEKLEIQEIELPKINDDQVLIQVQAAGVNFPDALLVQGKYQVVQDPPFIPGNEIAGIIKEVGNNVGFKIGSKVIGLPELGGFAEEIILDKTSVIPIDSDFPSEVAAGLPINYGTSYYALKRRANLKKGEKLLILGAAGGIGTASIQLGKVIGAEIYAAVGSKVKEEYVKKLGADYVIRYDNENLKEKIKELTNNEGVDVVIDPVGGEYSEDAVRGTGWNGRYLVIGFANGEIPSIPLNLTLVKGVSIVGVWWGRWLKTSPHECMEDFGELLELIRNKKLIIEPPEVYPIEDTARALIKFLERKNLGKAVIKF